MADVVAENVAEDKIEGRLASSLDGARSVDVEFKGRPFLVQVLRGEFQGLGIAVGSLRRRGVRLRNVDLDLFEVSFSIRDVLAGSGGISVEGGSGRGAVAEDGLNVALTRQGLDATVSFSGEGASVAARGMEAEVEEVSVSENALSLSAPPLPPVEVALPVFLQGLSYERARIQDGKIVVFLDLPRTTLDPGSL